MNEKVLKVSFTKAISIFVGAILTTAVVTAFGVLSTLNSDHFTLVTVASELEEIKGDYVPKGEFAIHLQNIEKQLNDIKKTLERIESKP